MVLHKRQEYECSGCQVPAMLQVPKSAKGKRSIRKRVEENQMCAFDLLATLAGELLQEKENLLIPRTSCPSTPKETAKGEERIQAKAINSEPCDQGSCNECSVLPIFDGNNSEARTPGLVPTNFSTEVHSPGPAESIEGNITHTPKRRHRDLYDNDSGRYALGDLMELDCKSPTLVSSESSVEAPISTEHAACNDSFKFPDVMELLVDRDDDNDDDNSSGCTHPRTITSKAAKQLNVEDHRARKLMVSKYWKVAATTPRDGELFNDDAKPVFRNRKLCFTRQRTPRSSFKRRKVFERCSIPTSEGDDMDRVSISLGKAAVKTEASESSATLVGANGAASSMTDQKRSCQTRDFHVKLSIKSFKVPELFIEIPETATVGSLKRTVIEAVNTILGGGLRVGVLLQGKKVRDDNKTLIQTGISNGDKMDTLGFTLEPIPTEAPIPHEKSLEDPRFPIPCGDVEPLKRIPPAAATSDLGPSGAKMEPPSMSIVNCSESDHDSVHSPGTAPLQDRTTANSKALVAVSPMEVEALAVVPPRKPKRSELVQRRIRRPFSVSEVEALVQAVEKLGTGRWRDVKLRAFENAKHRTYVDLKDKWKTLVHTARISPQQRRGEPVPQELLDRVLSAHAYWSQQQAKLQVKPPPPKACLLL